MKTQNPPNATEVRKIVEERLAALKSIEGAQETVTIEWRGQPIHITVISMPVALLCYNPGTHRVRAQRSMNPILERELETNPYGDKAQSYLHQLLMGDPTDPAKIDPSFTVLKEDLQEHGQSEPGIITRAGMLVNGNTRQAALKELGQKNIRVGVLPPDAGLEDIQSIELALQLRKDHKRDYSFMNLLLAIDERADAGELAVDIQKDFRIKPSTYDRCRWILDFVRNAIERSKVDSGEGGSLAMRLVDFETHQGKLEELYRAYMGLKSKSSDEAEALREQRLLALALNKSKTDLRLIESDFAKRYMKGVLPSVGPTAASTSKIPGLAVTVAGPSQEVEALRKLTTQILQARTIASTPGTTKPADSQKANELLKTTDESLVKGLDRAGKQGRVVKKRFAAVDRVSDACDDLELAIAAVADARATGNFDASDLDEALVTLRSNLNKLSAIITRGSDSASEGIAWIRAVGEIASRKG
jgi:hypothetical protein